VAFGAAATDCMPFLCGVADCVTAAQFACLEFEKLPELR
jgi:hypothetical protein